MIENDFMLPLRFKTLSNFKKVDDESVEESLCKNIKKDFKDLSAEGYNSLTHSLTLYLTWGTWSILNEGTFYNVKIAPPQL